MIGFLFLCLFTCLVVVVVVVDFGCEGGFSWILAMSFMGLTMEVGCGFVFVFCLQWVVVATVVVVVGGGGGCG